MSELHLAFGLVTARVNLIKNVITDFSKNEVSTVPFSVTTDVVPYF